MIAPTCPSRNPAPVLLLARQSVLDLLNLDDCIVAVESAFAAHAAGRALATGLLHVDADGGEFHVKVGGLRAQRTYFACKTNGGFFENRARFGLPNITGMILLYDGSNGQPLAAMESGVITALRTAAATAVAAKYLARPESETVTLLGAGLQAQYQLRALTRVLPVKRVFIWSRSNVAEIAERLAVELNLQVLPARSVASAASVSDVIVTCTPARSWFLGRQDVSPGTFVAAVGADSPDKQELEPELLAFSSVVCDLTEQCARVGELHHAVSSGLMTSEQIRGELGAVIAGKAPRRLSADEIIVFDSTGTALQDVAAAATVYERAVSAGRGTLFALWS